MKELQYNVGDIVAYKRRGEYLHGIVQGYTDGALYVTLGTLSSYVTKISLNRIIRLEKRSRIGVGVSYDDIGKVCHYIYKDDMRIGKIIAVDSVHKLCLIRFGDTRLQIGFSDIVEIIR